MGFPLARALTSVSATLAAALLSTLCLVGVASPAAAAGGTVYVDATWAATPAGTDPDGSGPATSFGTDSFATIADALAVAPTRIELGPGVYVEQVIITSDVEIVGRGAGVTTIQDSVTYLPYYNRHAIVIVRNAATATLSNLTVTGPNTNSGGIVFVGVYVVDAAKVNLHDVNVSAIQNQPFNGQQTGIGILVGESSNGSLGTAELNRVTVSDYQKVGMVIRAGSTATVSDSLFQGRGLTCVNAQNGIQIEGGAIITSTTVVDHRYDDQPGVSGCGSGGTTQADQVMSYGIRANNTTSAVSITGSTIARNENNITVNSPAAAGAALEITNNTITGLAGVAVGRVLADTSAGIHSEWARPGGVISGNTITQTTWGIDAVDNGGESITSNTFTSNGAAAQFDGDPAVFAANRIVGNTSGVIGTAGTGGPNWWGCNAGPSTVGCDSIVGAYSEADWLVLAVELPVCTVQVGSAIEAEVTLTTTFAGLDYVMNYVPPTTVTLVGSSELSAAPALGITNNGALPATLTGIATGSATASATVDNASVLVPGDTNCTQLTVTAAPDRPIDELAATGVETGPMPALFALLLIAFGSILTRRVTKAKHRQRQFD